MLLWGFVVGLGMVAAAEDLPAITTRGTLRVLVAMDTQPEAISLQEGTAPGLEREMLEGFAALRRLKVEFIPVPLSADRIPALLAGKGDVIAGGFAVSEERRKQVDFTSDVFRFRHVVVTRQPHPPVETLDELRRLRVGTLKGSTWATTIAEVGVPHENIDDSYAGAGDVLEALRQGKVGALVMGSGWALAEMRRDPLLHLGLLIGPPVGRAWAVHKHAPQLRQALDEYVSNMRKGASWSRLVVKYYGDIALEVLKKGQ